MSYNGSYMKIAVISDTHDNLAAVITMVEQVKQRGLETVICCGDVVAPPILKEMIEGWKDAGIKMYFVFGNNDGEKMGLVNVAGGSNGVATCMGDYGELELAGKKIWWTHDSAVAELVARSGQFDFCFGGHDHRQRKVVVESDNGETVFVNPGNLTVKRPGEWRKSDDHCWSVVDLASGEVERVEVE
jgi:putative phosphoesterase